MIAVSALLVLVALVALVVRLVGASVSPGFETVGTILTYGSIVLCVVAAVLLVAGYLSGRKKTVKRRSDKPGRKSGAGRKASGAPRSGGGGRRKPDSRRKAPTRKAAAAGGRAAAASGGVDVLDDGEVPGDSGVVVVPGRLRYHLSSCRQVTGRETEELTVAEAQEQGYVACTACRPDSVLAARAEAAGAEEAEEAEPAAAREAEAVEDTSVEDAGPAQVLVVSGQRRYHLAGCQVVEDAREDGTEVTETTLADAKKQNLTPCRVCAAG